MTTYTKTTATAWSITAVIALVLLCIFGFTLKFAAVLLLSLALDSYVHFVAGIIIGVDREDDRDEYESPNDSAD